MFKNKYLMVAVLGCVQYGDLSPFFAEHIWIHFHFNWLNLILITLNKENLIVVPFTVVTLMVGMMFSRKEI